MPLTFASFLLVVLLITAGVCDVMWRRVPNVLVLVLLVSGVGAAFTSSGLPGVVASVLLACFGLLLWLPFYALRMLGAGDVKLFAAGSSWLASLSYVLTAAAVTAIVGGVLALVWAIAQRRAISMVGNLLTTIRFRIPVVFDTHRTKLPYGIAMGIGILWAFTMGL